MTTGDEIKEWFDEGKNYQASYMLVVFDTFSYEHYPVFITVPKEDFWEEYDKRHEKNMQRVIEVYDLSKPWEDQLERRVHNAPPRPKAKRV